MAQTVFDLSTTATIGDVEYVEGYYSPGDGAAGTYRCIGITGFQENGGTVIKVGSGLNVRYWGLLHDGTVSPHPTAIAR